MKLATITIHDSQPTTAEIRDSYPSLWKMVDASSPAAWIELFELLRAERARTRLAVMESIAAAMAEAIGREGMR